MWHCTFGQEILRVWRIVVSSSVSVSPRNWHSSKNAWLWSEGTYPLQNCSPDSRCHIAAHLNLQQHSCEDITSYKMSWQFCCDMQRFLEGSEFIYYFFYCHVSSRNCNIPTLSKYEIRNSSVTSHIVVSVPGFMISLIYYLVIPPHWSSQQLITWYSFVMKLYQ